MANAQKPKIQGSMRELRERMRAELEARYAKAFGSPWDRTPWDCSWLALVKDAQAAQLDYAAAAWIIREMYEHLAWAGGRVVENERDVGEPFDSEKLVGLTRPTAFLYEQFSKDGAMWQVLLKLREMTDWLDDPTGYKVMMHDAAARERAKTQQLRPRANLRDEFHELLRRTASRRLAHLEVRDWFSEKLMEEQLGTAILLRPTGALEGDEWRRAYLAELLDTYPLHASTEAPGFYDPPTNGEIAVLSLLLGRLDALSRKELERGVVKVIDQERKAVALARKRRATCTCENCVARARASSDLIGGARRPATTPDGGGQ